MDKKYGTTRPEPIFLSVIPDIFNRKSVFNLRGFVPADEVPSTNLGEAFCFGKRDCSKSFLARPHAGRSPRRTVKTLRAWSKENAARELFQQSLKGPKPFSSLRGPRLRGGRLYGSLRLHPEPFDFAQDRSRWLRTLRSLS